MKPTPEEISAEVAAMLEEREANAVRARERAARAKFVGAPDYLGVIRSEWVESGIMPPDSGPNAAPPPPRAYDPVAEARKSRLGQFRGICPSEFLRTIDRGLIPSLPAWDQADAWDGSHPGLWLWSKKTGQAKTRMLWRHFGRLFVEGNRRCIRVGGVQLGEVYFKYHMKGNPDDFYSLMTNHDVVFIDDLDKINLRNDDRVSIPRMLHELFNKFYEAHKPVLVTANESIEFFRSRLGESADRRINAVCAKEIEF